MGAGSPHQWVEVAGLQPSTNRPGLELWGQSPQWGGARVVESPDWSKQRGRRTSGWRWQGGLQPSTNRPGLELWGHSEEPRGSGHLISSSLCHFRASNLLGCVATCLWGWSWGRGGSIGRASALRSNGCHGQRFESLCHWNSKVGCTQSLLSCGGQKQSPESRIDWLVILDVMK